MRTYSAARIASVLTWKAEEVADGAILFIMRSYDFLAARNALRVETTQFNCYGAINIG
jgi:hypothetical protein